MLKNKKIILITGGSRGIGKSIAIKLGKNNNFVIITYKKNKNYAQKVVEEIKVNGGEAFSIKMDISCEISINETIENIKCKYDSVDILVNNAGISQEKPFLDISIRDWEEM
ncbi:MAG: SDR family NAD(P)-dependent oxidoreductase, partial [Pseudomonadota bacterium]|nr:SDR family NAD(P)-dependent oxidoreductase [Pseudomonadota bacterium]